MRAGAGGPTRTEAPSFSVARCRSTLAGSLGAAWRVAGRGRPVPAVSAPLQRRSPGPWPACAGRGSAESRAAGAGRVRAVWPLRVRVPTGSDRQGGGATSAAKPVRAAAALRLRRRAAWQAGGRPARANPARAMPRPAVAGRPGPAARGRVPAGSASPQARPVPAARPRPSAAASARARRGSGRPAPRAPRPLPPPRHLAPPGRDRCQTRARAGAPRLRP